MAIRFRRFEEADVQAIDRFNRRMEAAGSPNRLYREELWKNPDRNLDVRPVNDSLFVAADDTELRGGTWLREQYFWVDGQRQKVGWMKYAIAESQVDPKLSMVPFIMVKSLEKEQPNLMALGIGGHDAPFARLLDAVGWASSTIPFFFRILKPFRVLRDLAHLRRRPGTRLAMDLAAWSGTGWLAHTLYQSRRAVGSRPPSQSSIEATFGTWADEVWESSRNDYHALALRDARSLGTRHFDVGLERVRVKQGNRDAGWVVTRLDTGGDLAPYFGNLRVGILMDMLSRASEAGVVLRAGLSHLRAAGADIVVTNLSHDVWVSAARRLGFLSGPSNMAFYRSRKADALLGGTQAMNRWHLTRTDD